MQVGIWLVVLTVLALSQARQLVFVNPDGGIDNFHEALRTYRRIGTSVNTFISHFLSGTANGTEKLSSVSFPNVSALCLEQMFVIASQINPSQPPPEWIIRFLDAQAKPPNSILEGNVYWHGGFHQCMNLTATYQDGSSHEKALIGQYCLVTVGVEEHTMKQKTSDFPQIEKALKAGVCVPSACSPDDVHSLLDFALELVEGKYPEVMTDARNVSVLNVHCPQREIPLTPGAIVVIAMLIALATLVFAGTMYDVLTNGLFWQHDGILVESSLSSSNRYTTLLPPDAIIASEPELEERNARSLVGRILMCFSAAMHCKRMFRTGRVVNELPWIHGIRVLSMFWVILGQSVALAVPVYDNLAMLPDSLKQIIPQVGIQAAVAVDTFLFISGFLTAFHFLNGLAAGGFSCYRLIRLYVHRYFRIFPAYMVVLAIYATLMKHMSNGPLWPQDEAMLGNCSNLALTNAFYINNFVQPERMCMPWTWYIAIEFQLFLLAPLVVLALFTFWRIGLALCAVGGVVAVLAAGIISKVKGLPPSLFGFGSTDVMTLDQELSLQYFTSYFIATYTRAAPYFIGIAAAHFLKDPPNVRRVGSLAVGVGWVLALAGLGTVVFGLLPGFNGHPLSVDASAAYNSLSHVVWAAALAWIFYSCITSSVKMVERVLSWSAWASVSTMSYSVYLVSPIVISAYYLSRETSIHYSLFNAFFLFWGHLVMSLLAGLVIYLFVEAPIRSLTNQFLTRRRSRSVIIDESAKI